MLNEMLNDLAHMTNVCVMHICASQTKQTSSSVWRWLPDAPYKLSSACVVESVLLAIGGEELNGQKVSSIFAFNPLHATWQHVADMPFACSKADTLLLSNGDLLIADGHSQRVLRGKMEG